MRRTMAAHVLVDRVETDREVVVMACGLRGRVERHWPGEFTTMDGREARLCYVETHAAATCRSCLRAIQRAIREG